MARINDMASENGYRNDLGRENRGAIKRSVIMAVLAVGAVIAAVLLAPPSNPMPTMREAAVPSAAVSAEDTFEHRDPIGASFHPQHTPRGEAIGMSFSVDRPQAVRPDAAQ